jgi:hypothetical protein
MTDDTRTHWKQLADTRYIGAYALPNGADLTVTIAHVGREQVTVTGGKKEDHIVMHLAGHKPMILNSTNSKSIQMLYGPYIEDWAGKQITLYGSTARLGNELVECLRIRPAVPASVAKKPISRDRFVRALEQIRRGSYTAAKLRAGFALNSDQELSLAALEAGPAEALAHE